jgi:hypothetical protein
VAALLGLCPLIEAADSTRVAALAAVLHEPSPDSQPGVGGVHLFDVPAAGRRACLNPDAGAPGHVPGASLAIAATGACGAPACADRHQLNHPWPACAWLSVHPSSLPPSHAPLLQGVPTPSG